MSERERESELLTDNRYVADEWCWLISDGGLISVDTQMAEAED